MSIKKIAFVLHTLLLSNFAPSRLRAFTLSAFCFLPLFVFSQQDSVKYWNLGGDVTFTMSQITLNNWAAGGKSSVTGNFMANGFAN
jgi:hypothetical protein